MFNSIDTVDEISAAISDLEHAPLSGAVTVRRRRGYKQSNQRQNDGVQSNSNDIDCCFHFGLTRLGSLAAIDFIRVVARVAESSRFFVHQKTIGAGHLFGNTVTTFQKLVASRGIWEIAVRVRAVGWTGGSESGKCQLKERKQWVENRQEIPWAQARKANVITSCNAAMSLLGWVRWGVVHLRVFHTLLQS